jgi:hypothetical protein
MLSTDEHWNIYKPLCRCMAAPYAHCPDYEDLLQYLHIQAWRACLVYADKPEFYQSSVSELTHVYARVRGAVRDYWKDGNNYIIHKPRGEEPIVVHQLDEHGYDKDNCRVERVSSLQ